MALSNDFQKRLEEEYQTRMRGFQPQSVVTSTPPPPEPGSFRSEETPVRIHGDISEQEQIEKFGGVVGSREYYEKQAGSSPAAQLLKRVGTPIGVGTVGGFLVGGPFGSVIGAGFGGGVAANLMPPQEVWDKMSTTDKVSHIGYRTVEFPIKLITGIPEFFIKSVPNIVSQVSRPFREGVSPLSLKGVEKLAVSEVEKPDVLPGIGELDPLYGTMLKEYMVARGNGWGDNVSTVYAYAQGGRQILDYTIATAIFAKGIRSMVRPPKKLAPGEKVADVGPIEEQLRLSEEKLAQEAGVKKDGPASIYISTEKSYSNEVAARTGRSGQAVIKITPAGDNSVKVSLVQVEGLVGKIKSRFGLGDEGGVRGARGKEFEVESQIVKIEKNVVETKQIPVPEEIQAASSEVFTEMANAVKGERMGVDVVEGTGAGGGGFITRGTIAFKSTFPEWVGPKDLRSRALFDSLSQKLFAGETKFSKPEMRLLDIIKEEVAKRSGRNVAEIDTQSLVNEFKTVIERIEKGKKIEPISQPYPGSENRPITRKQVDNIYLISEVGGFEPAVTDMIIRTLTGKRAVGELTNAEYVNVTKTLSETNRLGEFFGTGQASLWTKWVGQYVSPPRSWMESVQRKTGIPIYDTWLDLENGYRLSRTYAQSFMDESRTIWGDYAAAKFTNERRLVDAHMRGDQNAIVNNPNLTPQIKADLLKIVDGVSSFFEQHGPALGVEKQFYKKNEFGYYLPDIIDIGGIIERYKAGATIPTGKEFFATKQKRGGNYIRVDDPLKLMDIYARQGSEAKFLNESIGRAHELHDKVPSEFRTSYRSAVLEKMGYEGRFTKFLDEVTSRISQKLGIRLPADAGRKLNQSMLSYAYINALDSPTTWFRNVLMNNILLYTKFGPEFLGQAALKGFSPEGLAEVRGKGFLNETSQAFGADIGTAAGKVKQVAEIGLAPVGVADSTGRGTAYFATRSHFENAIKLYNEGKISWNKAEKMLDLDGMSPIEANRVRAALKAGDMELAFNEMARSVIDETNFPYRRGSSARITYGGGGNIATFLYKWNIEFLHTTGRWIRTGQWDKVFRYYTASSVTVRAMKDAYGADFTKSVGFGPLEQRYPATVKIGLDFINMFQSVQSGNAEALDDAHEELTRALKTFGIPGGVDTKNWQDFWRSYSKGPDRNGKFSIIGPRGDLLAEGVPFSELWARMFGLPTVLKVETGKTERAAIGYKFEVAKAKRKVAELRNAGKEDEADALVSAWDALDEDIEPDRKSYDRFERPRSERIFEKLPPGGQELFESRLLK